VSAGRAISCSFSASIGACIGLGNFWRFPYQCYSHGGGAFLIPYLLALIVIGVPIVTLEFILGARMQCGILGAMLKVHPRAGGVGFAAALLGICFATYYSVLMAWSWIFFIGSFKSTLPWEADTDALAETKAEDYFYNDVLDRNSSLSDGLGGLQWELALSLIGVWLAIFLCIQNGVKSVGWVVLVTMPLPFVLLVILFFRSVTLSNAGDGIEFYLKPDFNKYDGITPVDGMTQIFFSTGIGQGILVALSSYNQKSNQVKNALLTTLLNSFASLMCGFVVFGVLGYMSGKMNCEVDQVIQDGSFGLAFIVFPAALAMMPAPQFFSVLFFLTLLNLGVDSAFAMVEAFTTILHDRFPQWSLRITAAVACVVCMLTGLMYCTEGGYYLMDLVDHYMSAYAMVTVTGVECIVIGWFGNGVIEELAKDVEEFYGAKMAKAWIICIKFVEPVLCFYIVLYNIIKDLHDGGYNDYPDGAQAFGWCIFIGFIGIMVLGAVMPQLFASPETAQSIDLDAGESSEMSDKELHQKEDPTKANETRE